MRTSARIFAPDFRAENPLRFQCGIFGAVCLTSARGKEGYGHSLVGRPVSNFDNGRARDTSGVYAADAADSLPEARHNCRSAERCCSLKRTFPARARKMSSGYLGNRRTSGDGR